MFLAGIMSWWYGNGLRLRLAMIGGRIARTNDYFSIGLLASTLFSPYRQISAGNVSGPLSLQLRAFVDRLISRFIGAVVRSFMILFGVVAIGLQVISGAVFVFFWILIPLFPVIGLLLVVIGWVPQWL
ncbi:hypothetical protein H7X69_01450 [Candidatus Saccharibacteria bacterium]|nr:hypothetical protein [Candidatus Saccharibacteria bacterium]